MSAAALLEQASPPNMIEIIQKHRATVCFTAPTAYRAMLKAMVAQIVLWLKPDSGTDLLYEALHHDSAEQFVGDLPQPFKVAADKGFIAYHTELERLAREKT